MIIRRHGSWIIVSGFCFLVVIIAVFLRLGKSPAPASFVPDELLASMRQKKVDAYTEIRDHLPSILIRGGIEKTVNLVERAFILTDISLNDCHTLLHLIGHEAYSKEKDHLDRLVLISQPCQDSIQHGVEAQIVLTYKNPSEIKAELARYCAEIHKKYPGNTCYHGAGHAFLQTYRNAKTSLDSCDMMREDEKTDLSDCYRGVFSEYGNQVMGIDTDTGLQIPVKIPLESDTNNPLLTCSTFAPKYAEACYSQLTKLLFQADNFEGSLNNCMRDEYTRSAREICTKIISALNAEHVLLRNNTLPVYSFVMALDNGFRRAYVDGIYLAFESYRTSGVPKQWQSVCAAFSDTQDRQYCQNKLAPTN